MDPSALQAQIDALQNSVSTDETQLAADQEALVKAQADLAVISLVNSIEALTEDQVTTINGLLAEPSNSLNISLTVGTPSTAADASTGTSETSSEETSSEA